MAKRTTTAAPKPRYCDECGLGLAPAQTTENCPRCCTAECRFCFRRVRVRGGKMAPHEHTPLLGEACHGSNLPAAS